MVAAHLAHTSRQDQIAALTLLVTVLDQSRAGLGSAVIDERNARLAASASAARGYLDGRSLAEVFAWLRPGDLVWNYWVNNYLLGRKPPAFDILFWNADTTRMPARLHADFVNLAMENWVVTRGALSEFYSHPWTWNEIGFGGPAYPRGYVRLGPGQRESWEAEAALDIDPVPDTKRRGLE